MVHSLPPFCSLLYTPPLSLLYMISRVINAGKSMLNEDQASCEKLFVKKPSGKHRSSPLQEDPGVRVQWGAHTPAVVPLVSESPVQGRSVEWLFV